MENRDLIFDAICKMSDGQVDPIVKTSLKEMIGKEDIAIEEDLAKLIGNIRYCSLTSGFELECLCVVLSVIESEKDLDFKVNSKRVEL